MIGSGNDSRIRQNKTDRLTQVGVVLPPLGLDDLTQISNNVLQQLLKWYAKCTAAEISKEGIAYSREYLI